MRAGALSLLCVAVSSAPALAWLATVPGLDPPGYPEPWAEATTVAVDANGDVVAGGSLSGSSSNTSKPFVTKRAAANGAELWRQDFPSLQGCNLCWVKGLRLDAQQDVLVTGTMLEPPAIRATIAVAKLDGTTGAIDWLSTIVESNAAPGALAVGLDGDAIVGGTVDTIPSGSTEFDFVVLRYQSSDGSLVWRRQIDGVGTLPIAYEYARAVAVDGSDDVFATGVIEDGPDQQFAVVKLDGATGADAWPQPVLVGAGSGVALAVDPATDDVIAVGHLDVGGLWVVRLASADGAEQWRTQVTNSLALPADVELDAAGDVIVGGQANDGSGSTWMVAKLDATSGAELWQATPAGSMPDPFYQAVKDVTVAPDGDIVAVGQLAYVDSGTDVSLARIDPSTGAVLALHRFDSGLQGPDVDSLDDANAVALAPDGAFVVVGSVLDAKRNDTAEFAMLQFGDRLAGKSMVVRESGAKSLFALRIRDPNVLAVAPGAEGDPTLQGATLEVRNPDTNEAAVLSLPAALWQSKDGAALGVQTYKYADRTASAGPCKSVTVKNLKAIKVKCIGSLPGLTLDEPSQGTLRATLTLGTGAGRYCVEFDAPKTDQPGLFKGSRSLPPAGC